jgi:hypothetical protein
MHVQSVRNRTCGLEQRPFQHEHNFGINMIESGSLEPMFGMDIFSAAMYLAHLKFNRAQRVSMHTELSA